MVFAFAGDSTINRFFAIRSLGVYKLKINYLCFMKLALFANPIFFSRDAILELSPKK